MSAWNCASLCMFVQYVCETEKGNEDENENGVYVALVQRLYQCFFFPPAVWSDFCCK